MRKTVLAWAILALCLGFSTPAHAQNLVLNPSFEEMKGCPGPVWSDPTIDSAMHCFNLLYDLPLALYATPDYNHDCVSPYFLQPYTILSNSLWVETPRTGLAMAGFATYIFPNEYREYIGMTLSQALQKDTTYYVSLYVSRADSINYATDINVYFAWNKPTLNHYGALDSVPQIASSDAILNHKGWTKIEGTFTAKGGERYLIIGNQFKDNQSKVRYVNSKPTTTDDSLYWAFAYYNVDDVYVGKVSLSHLEDGFATHLSEYYLYPNPASEKVFLQGQENELCMLTWYNSIGNKVKYSEVLSGQSIEVSDLPRGLYIVHIQGKKGFTIQKMLIH